jgi:hypothetical protein
MERLTLEQFKKSVEEEVWYYKIDALCLDWLKQAAEDLDKDLGVTMKLLAVVEELLEELREG